MATPIAEDYAAIRDRLAAIRAAERATAPPEAAPPAVASSDFYGWLMGGGIWAVGPAGAPSGSYHPR